MTIQRVDVNKFFNRKFNYEKNSEYGIEKIKIFSKKRSY